MLPLRGAFAKPAVIGEIKEEIGGRIDAIPCGLWEHILEADEDAGAEVEGFDIEPTGLGAGFEAAVDGGDIAEEGEPAAERDVFAEDDEPTFAVIADELTGGRDGEGAIEVEGVVWIGGLAIRFGVVGSEDHPGMRSCEQIGDGLVIERVVTEQVGGGGLGPDEQVGFGGKGDLREADQFGEAVGIFFGIEDEILGDAGLYESDLEVGGGLGGVGDLVEAEEQSAGDGEERQGEVGEEGPGVIGAEEGFGVGAICGCGVGVGGEGGEETGGGAGEAGGEPSDEEGDAVDAGDGGDLDEGNGLILGGAEEIPREAGEQSGACEFETGPGDGADESP